IEMKDKLRRVFEDDALGQRVLQHDAVVAELLQRGVLFVLLAEGAEVHVADAQIGRHAHRINGDERGVERELARQQVAQLVADEFLDSGGAVFHGGRGWRVELRRGSKNAASRSAFLPVATGGYSFCAIFSSWYTSIMSPTS